MFRNGNVIVLLRCIICGIITIVSLALGAWLMSRAIEVPLGWWAIAAAGVAGVAGGDVADVITRNKGAGNV